MNKNKIIIGGIVIATLAMGFYYIAVLPRKIKAQCYKDAETRASNVVKAEVDLEMRKPGTITKMADYITVREDFYSQCIREKGIE
jgi:hypothetical protein